MVLKICLYAVILILFQPAVMSLTASCVLSYENKKLTKKQKKRYKAFMRKSLKKHFYLKGFSLFEVALVLAIVGLLATAVFKGYGHQRGRGHPQERLLGH